MARYRVSSSCDHIVNAEDEEKAVAAVDKLISNTPGCVGVWSDNSAYETIESVDDDTEIPQSNPPELSEQFGGHWGEHPTYLFYEWRVETWTNSTRLGYWDWVSDQIDMASTDDNAAKPLAGHCDDGGGVQKHSAGEFYPWVIETQYNASIKQGIHRAIHPNGKHTPWHAYGATATTFEAAYLAACNDARRMLHLDALAAH